MGAWAEGNFDNDSALDFVSDLANSAAVEMRPPQEVEDIDLVMAAVEVRKALVAHCHAAPPDAGEIAALKDAVLRLYDEEIDSLEPAPDYKIGRRQVIAATFDEFLAIVK